MLLEQPLRASEELHQLLWDRIPQPLWLYDPETLSFLAVNEAAVTTYGYTRKEFLSMTIKDIRQPGDIPKFLDRLSREDSRTHNISARHKKKDGTVFDVEITSSSVEIDGLRARLVLATDITERLRVEEELSFQKALFEAQSEASIDGILVVSSAGRILSQNKRFVEMWGIPPRVLASREDEAALQSVLDKLADAEGFIAKVKYLYEHPDEVSRDEIQLKDGRTLDRYSAPIQNSEGKNCGRVWYFRDITSRKRVEDDLRKQKELLQKIFDNIPLMVSFFDADGQVVLLNRAWERTRGWKLEEIRRQNLDILTESYPDPDDRQRARDAIDASTGEWSDFTIKVRDGRRIDTTWAVVPVGDGTRFAIGQDITENKRAEEQVRLSERRFRQLAENIHEVFWVVDPNKREMLYVNPVYEQVWGRSCQSLYERPESFIEAVHPEDRDRVSAAVERQRYGEKFDAEYRIERPDGSIHWIHDCGFPIKDEAGKVIRIVGVAEDITERKHADDQLRELTSALENAVEGIGRLDARGCYVYVNQAYADLAGYTPEEMIGTPWQPTVVAEDQAKMADAYSRMLSDGKVEVAARGVRKDGSVFHKQLVMVSAFDREKKFNGHYCFMKDITDRKRAEEEMFRLIAAVEQTADSIVITDTGGIIQYVNPAFERITGYAKDEAIGRTPSFLKSGKTEWEVYRDLWETIKRGEVWTGQLINRRKDRSLYEERVTISPLRDSSGEIINFVAVKQDITQHVQLEDQFRQAQKMEAVGKLAGGVAHDFNNLLTAINGYSDLTLRKLRAEDPLRSNIEEIKKSGQRAARLTSQLLAFSRKQVLQPTVLDLNTIISDLSKMLQRLIGEDVQLQASLDPALGRVKADRGQIEQVLLNLAVNARDAMPEGGKLLIETKCVDLDQEYAARHVAITPGPYVLLAVSDTGCGMDEETRGRIFEPFFTTKGVGRGTGLGLSTVYGIIKQSGGSIWVYSEVGIGTTFKIYLPRLDEAPDEQAPGAKKADLVQGTETVLLVEDEEMVRNLARQILEACGYRVLDAPHGGAALLRCERHEGQIHLMLSDVVMPEMSGRDLARRLLPLRPEMQVLFMSGYTDHAVMNHGVLDANTHFIQKPFSPDALAHKVREVLDNPVNPGPPKGRMEGAAG